MIIFTLGVLLAQALLAIGQSAVPTNSTLPAGFVQNSELLLLYNDQHMAASPQYNIDFASDASAGQKSSPNVLQAVFVNSTMLRITPANLTSLVNGSIAYISCDPQVYSQSQLGLKATIQAATARISAVNPKLGAIVLYSVYSGWCNYVATDSYNYTNVFILPGQVPALNLESLLLAASTTQVAQIYSGTITRNGTAFGPDSNNPNDAPSSNNSASGPSTTIAMIILYSVTGIITLCFVLVIVTGALRARRHPERYGLLNLPTNAHNRRARGIARAMLETIPIVKFGERVPIKATQDTEQGTEMRSVEGTDNPAQREENVVSSSPTSVPVDSAAANSVPAEPQVDGIADVDTSENGLACSVCTEDFIIGQDLRVLPCNHKFHPECIDPWLLNVSGTCPLCRIDLRSPEERDELDMETTEGSSNPTQAPVRNHTAILNYQPPRFSVFLNRRSMGESTPAQRLRALRALRNHNRNGGVASSTADANGGDAVRSSSDPTEEHTSRSNRVSRFFSRSQSRATTPPLPAQPITADTTSPTVEPSRNVSLSDDQTRTVPGYH